MTKLNKNTKKAKRMISMYNHSFNDFSNYTIYGFYKNPSYNKIKAFNHCINVQQNMSGKNGCIVGGNSSYFSYAFECEIDGKNYLYYITYANDYIIELD